MVWRALLRPRSYRQLVVILRNQFVFAAEQVVLYCYAISIQVTLYCFAISKVAAKALRNPGIELTPFRNRHSDGGRHKRRASPYPVSCCRYRLYKLIALIGNVEFNRTLDKHDRRASRRALFAGKSSRRSPEKKKTAAAAGSFTCDPKAVAITANEEQRDRVVQNSAVRPRRQLRGLSLDVQFAIILPRLFLPNHFLHPIGKPGAHDLALA